MKPIHRFIACITIISLAGLFSSSALHAAEVDIGWDEPERFSDVSDDYGYVQNDFEYFKEEFTRYVKKLADRHMPPDASLSFTIRDVDLAGEIEPWRTAPNHNIRIVRDIYPPRLKFNYNISYSGDGMSVDENGMAQLTDLTFLWNLERSVRGDDPFFYEKELMEDWFRRRVQKIFE